MTNAFTLAENLSQPPVFGLLIVGDEILSGKRADKHLPKVAELLAARGLSLAWARCVGDDRDRITATLREAFASDEVVFSCGGIGATPDDHTRQCAAAALGVELALHPEAKMLIEQRMREIATEHGEAFDPQRPDNVHRYNMGVFPAGARLIQNPYNKIPGFSCDGHGGGTVHFLPGFPVMAWPLMEGIERMHEVKVFSLPSVDHPQFGRHIELGVKGEPAVVGVAFAQLLAGLQEQGARLGPEMVR
jgi:molybdopterin-biosynthesis enzyme MoeA-like protein